MSRHVPRRHDPDARMLHPNIPSVWLEHPRGSLFCAGGIPRGEIFPGSYSSPRGRLFPGVMKIGFSADLGASSPLPSPDLSSFAQGWRGSTSGTQSFSIRNVSGVEIGASFLSLATTFSPLRTARRLAGEAEAFFAPVPRYLRARPSARSHFAFALMNGWRVLALAATWITVLRRMTES